MLGAELRKARERVGMTQEQLALRARVDRSYLSELEREKKSPTVAMLLRICQTLGVSAGRLVTRVEKAQAQAKPRASVKSFTSPRSG